MKRIFSKPYKHIMLISFFLIGLSSTTFAVNNDSWDGCGTPKPVASGQTFCGSTTVGDLVATGSNIKWYQYSWSTVALITAKTITSSGTYYVTQTVGGCESDKLAVQVTISSKPSKPYAYDQSLCGPVKTPDLTPKGGETDYYGTTTYWYNTLAGGSPIGTSATLFSGTYYVGATNSDGCESDRTKVVLTITTTSEPTASSNQSFCGATTVNDLNASGTNIQWYANINDTYSLGSYTSVTTGTYYVTQTANGCESAKKAVNVTVGNPSVPTASDQSFCTTSNATVGDLTASGTNLKWYNSSSGGTALNLSTSLSSGYYYVSQTVNGCESSRTSVYVSLVSPPSSPFANSTQTFCAPATVADLSASGGYGNTINWYDQATGGSVLSLSTSLSSQDYYVSQSNNGCESGRTKVTVTVNSTPEPTASTTQTFCNSAAGSDLTATGSNITWYDASNNVVYSYDNLSSGDYYVTQTKNGCESPKKKVTVTINQPSAPTSSDQIFCGGSVTISDLNATGSNVKWYDYSSGGTAHNLTDAINSSGYYYASQTINGCESSTRTQIYVTISTTPSAPTASATQTLCAPAIVADLSVSGGYGNTINWYDQATGGSVLSPSTPLTSQDYYVSQSNGGCESTRTKVNVTVKSTPEPTASTTQTFCNSATVGDLSATGSNIQWYDASNNVVYSYDNLSSGDYYVTQTKNGCESPKKKVTVTINQPSAPTSSDQIFCGGSVTISDLNATGSNVKWYDYSSGGTAHNLTDAINSSGYYYASQTINGCESSTRTQIYITITTTPSKPSASATQTLCAPATVADLSASGGYGNTINWYDQATGGSVLSLSTSLTSQDYYVSQSNNGCESGRTKVMVTVKSTPEPTASTTQTFCNSATGSDLTATGSNITWYDASNNVVYSYDNLSSGDYYVTQTKNGCESPKKKVTVTINQPSAPTASDQTFCGGSVTISDLNATGSNVKWYDYSSGGTAHNLTDAINSSGYYYASQTINGCESSTRTQIYVTITTTPSKPSASATQTLCAPATVADLTANGGFGNTINWYNQATGGSVLSPSTTLTSQDYYVSQSNGGCESARTKVTVVINNTTPPAPTVTTPQTYCGGTVIADLSPSGAGINWYQSASSSYPLSSSHSVSNGDYYVSKVVGGCESPKTKVSIVVNNPSSPTAVSPQNFCYSAQVSDLQATGVSLQWYSVSNGGSSLTTTTSLVDGHTYYVSQTVGGCEGVRTAVMVHVSNPSKPTTVSQEFCGTASVGDLQATGQNISWYTSSNGGVSLSSSTPVTSGIYYASQSVNGCESDRRAVNVSVYTLPDASFSGLASTYCINDNGSTLIPAITGGVFTGNGINGNTFNPNDAGVGDYTIYYTVTDNHGCVGKDSAKVSVNGLPVVNAGSDKTICEGASVTLTALNPDGATITWDNNVVDGVAFTPTQTNKYTVTAIKNGCSSIDSVKITLKEGPTVSAGSDQTICEGELVSLTAQNPENATISWNNNINDGESFAPPQTATYVVTATLGGCSSTDAVVVTVNPVPSVSAGSDQSICEGDKVILTVQNPDNASISWNNGVQDGVPFTPTTTKTYTVTATLNSCSATDEVKVIIKDPKDCINDAGISENSIKMLSVIPNPASDYVTLKTDKNNRIEKVRLVSFIGKIIPIRTVFKDKQSIQLDVSAVSDGAYFLQITINGRQVIKKIIIQ